MTLSLLFVLILAHRQTQLVQASSSIALPLSVHSPYFSCWLPQLNTSSLYHVSEYSMGTATASNLSHVRVFSSFDLPVLRYFSLF